MVWSDQILRMGYYGYLHRVLMDACMNTVGTHMGYSEHCHGGQNRVLGVLTSGTERTNIGTVGTHAGYCACLLELA